MGASGEGEGLGPDGDPGQGNVGALLAGFRRRLERMVALRLDPRLRSRVDPADVLQEAFLDVVRRIEEFRATRPMSFFLWVRWLAAQKLLEFHRRHLGAERRDARREHSLLSCPEPSSVTLAPAFLDPATTPSKAAERKETLQRVQQALEELDEVDRETLVLRYFEQLSNEETATVLGLSVSGAKKRHVRALDEMKRRLRDLGGALGSAWRE